MKKGFTFTEIMVALSIFSLLMASLGVFRYFSYSAYKTSETESELHEIWKGVLVLNRDLRQAVEIIELNKCHLLIRDKNYCRWFYYVNPCGYLVKTKLKGFDEWIICRNVRSLDFCLESGPKSSLLSYFLTIGTPTGMSIRNNIVLRYLK